MRISIFCLVLLFIIQQLWKLKQLFETLWAVLRRLLYGSKNFFPAKRLWRRAETRCLDEFYGSGSGLLWTCDPKKTVSFFLLNWIAATVFVGGGGWLLFFAIKEPWKTAIIAIFPTYKQSSSESGSWFLRLEGSRSGLNTGSKSQLKYISNQNLGQFTYKPKDSDLD